MNYGQDNSQEKVPDFFTFGAGTNAENVNNVEPENNLDLTNTATEWELPMPDRDNREIGNRAIASAESLNIPSEPAANPQEDLSAQIEAITDNKAEQVSINPAIIQKNNDTTIPQIEEPNIKTDKFLSKEGIAAIDKAKAELDQTGDMASFYCEARDMMEVNLENSYNRKLAA